MLKWRIFCFAWCVVISVGHIFLPWFTCLGGWRHLSSKRGLNSGTVYLWSFWPWILLSFKIWNTQDGGLRIFALILNKSHRTTEGRSLLSWAWNSHLSGAFAMRACPTLTFIGNDWVLRSLAQRCVCLWLGESPPPQAREQPRDDAGSLHDGQETVNSGHLSNQKLVVPSCVESA